MKNQDEMYAEYLADYDAAQAEFLSSERAWKAALERMNNAEKTWRQAAFDCGNFEQGMTKDRH